MEKNSLLIHYRSRSTQHGNIAPFAPMTVDSADISAENSNTGSSLRDDPYRFPDGSEPPQPKVCSYSSI